MNFIEYVKQLWKNGPSGGTPWSAARLNHMEDGIKANNDMISELNSNISNHPVWKTGYYNISPHTNIEIDIDKIVGLIFVMELGIPEGENAYIYAVNEFNISWTNETLLHSSSYANNNYINIFFISNNGRKIQINNNSDTQCQIYIQIISI